MLSRLTIRNFVIVDSLELEFAAGFTALTGETGAGKSILIDALSLALGARADAGAIRAGAERAEISVQFDLAKSSPARAWLTERSLDDGAQCLLRRTVERSDIEAGNSATDMGALTRAATEASAPTRSRAYINGTPATVQQLRELGELLLDIHGQHAHQSLNRSEMQRVLLDEYGGLQNETNEVAQAFRQWHALQKTRVAAETNAAASEAERAQLQEQVRELEALALTPESWQALQDEHKRLAHAASLIEGASSTSDALNEGEGALLAQLAALCARTRALTDYDPQLKDIVALLDAGEMQLQEAARQLRRYRDRLDVDPQRLQEIDTRLEAVHRAARKYRARVDTLPQLHAQARERLTQLGASGSLQELRDQESAAQQHYLKLARQLSAVRKRVAAELSAKVSASLQSLAMTGARFETHLQPLAQPAVHGLEQVEFLVSSHAGLAPATLAKVVSGGELSRISLAIQVVLAKVAAVPTLIFDEVDAGIGGGVAEIVGRMLRHLGRERQVLCVTHLAQVAACADQQLNVAKKESKGSVSSNVAALDRAGRIEELARMLGGVKITETTRQHAAELLSAASKARR